MRKHGRGRLAVMFQSMNFSYTSSSGAELLAEIVGKSRRQGTGSCAEPPLLG